MESNPSLKYSLASDWALSLPCQRIFFACIRFLAFHTLDPIRDDLEDEALDHQNDKGESEGQGEEVEEDGTGNVEQPPNSAHELVYDRRLSFVIDDSPTLGPEAFLATRNAATDRDRSGQRRLNAIAV